MTSVVVRIVAVLIGSFLAASCGGIGIRQFLAFDAPVVALTHVRVIDGSGQPAKEDQTVIIEGDRITAVGAADSVTVPPGAKVTRFARPDGIAGIGRHARPSVLRDGPRRRSPGS